MCRYIQIWKRKAKQKISCENEYTEEQKTDEWRDVK